MQAAACGQRGPSWMQRQPVPRKGGAASTVHCCVRLLLLVVTPTNMPHRLAFGAPATSSHLQHCGPCPCPCFCCCISARSQRVSCKRAATVLETHLLMDQCESSGNPRLLSPPTSAPTQQLTHTRHTTAAQQAVLPANAELPRYPTTCGAVFITAQLGLEWDLGRTRPGVACLLQAAWGHTSDNPTTCGAVSIRVTTRAMRLVVTHIQLRQARGCLVMGHGVGRQAGSG